MSDPNDSTSQATSTGDDVTLSSAYPCARGATRKGQTKSWSVVVEQGLGESESVVNNRW
jgi:hypothetical protein